MRSVVGFQRVCQARLSSLKGVKNGQVSRAGKIEPRGTEGERGEQSAGGTYQMTAASVTSILACRTSNSSRLQY